MTPAIARAAGLVVPLLVAAGTAQAQVGVPQATVIAVHVDTLEGVVDTSYTLRVGSDTVFAFSEFRVRLFARWRMDLRGARDTIAALQRDTAALRAFRRQADETVETARTLITQLEAQLTDYRELTGIYRKLAAEEILSVEIGAGVTDWTDPRGALLAGVGFRHVRAWGFLQKGNSGAAVGVHLRLF